MSKCHFPCKEKSKGSDTSPRGSSMALGLIEMSPHDSTVAALEWDPASPHDAAEWFANVSVPWWIAGGWAIDLFLDRETRAHKDLDVGVLRRDVGAVLGSIQGWEVFEAKDRALTRLSHTTPRSDVNSLWCRKLGTQRWKVELMLDEAEGDLWIYRRHPGVRRTLEGLVYQSSDSIPYLAPEVQLLYKAKQARPQDELDFEAVVPNLSAEARNWLYQSLVHTLPSHPWRHKLERHYVA